MPRRHARADQARVVRPVSAGHDLEDHPDGAWAVRRLSGASGGGKAYRCPGCEREIAPGVPHVVAWPADSDGADRRHWHSACWAARDRRPPPRPGRATR